MRVYIAGPITNEPDGNRAAFEQRALDLKELGHESVHLYDIRPDHVGVCLGSAIEGEDHYDGCFLRASIEALMYCDAISLLPGWMDSRGACTEEHVARSLGLFVMHDGSTIYCAICGGSDYYGPLEIKHMMFVHRDNACPIDVDPSL